ncbi:MAG: hypothetical protein M1828_006164 [Chrysothrix sp. TS-e1954]|nr:MAG: hypothetical protein M1828_006164 [Chrysothrix sp. TS-e1954]
MATQMAPTLTANNRATHFPLHYSSLNNATNGNKTEARSFHAPLTPQDVDHSSRENDGTQKSLQPKPSLKRAQSDLNPRMRLQDEDTLADDESEATTAVGSDPESGWHLRHGWDYSAEQLRQLSSSFYLYFNDKRHESGGVPRADTINFNPGDWRMRDRLKTVSALLAICLNIGVDPPDVIKTNPCARLECWFDPTETISQPGQAPIDQIARNLEAQYSSISIRTKYKSMRDPTNEETKKYCCSLRKSAKDERILFHYNGHGVPKPTPSGEIWVFNKTYTQYIPVSLYDLQSWLGAPSLFVYDTSEAGLIIQNYMAFLRRHEAENQEFLKKDPTAILPSFDDSIHLAACDVGENLPTSPRLPADVFTACLTTPMEMAVQFFLGQDPLDHEKVAEHPRDVRIPGKVSERRTPIGELNWIFTAITDTIAWSRLPKPLFKKLFRQDLMVAALFRNFLLAQRIMRVHDCHPQSYPQIPSCHDHHLWESWDLAVETVVKQLPNIAHLSPQDMEGYYRHSDFFYEQLTAFEVYLDQGALEQKEPEQLPIVLQVLLSQVHRLRALILLSRFLDLGPWAVKLALGIGIFPYVVKLLQSQAVELKPVMVFIWARILAVDQSCQADLLKDNGYQYFIGLMNPTSSESAESLARAVQATQAYYHRQGVPLKEVSEHRAMCAFIIAIFCKNFRQGQAGALSSELIDNCLTQTTFPVNFDYPLLRQWSCLCLSMLFKEYPEAKWLGIRNHAHTRLCESTLDPVPEVRAAMLHALTNLLGIPDITPQIAQIEEGMASRVLIVSQDGSSLVRKELVIFFSAFVKRYMNRMTVAAFEQMASEQQDHSKVQDHRSQSAASSLAGSDTDNELMADETIYNSVWKHLLVLAVDPAPEVAHDASIVVNQILKALNRSSLGKHAASFMSECIRNRQEPQPFSNEHFEQHRLPHYGSFNPHQAQQPRQQDGYFAMGMRRTASVAASLKSLAFGSHEAPEPSTPQIPRGPPSLRSGRSDPLSISQRHQLLPEPQGPPSEDTIPTVTHQPAKFPTPRHYTPRSPQEASQIPLRSVFFDWSLEYFREPQMRSSENEEPGSEEYNGRLWRRTRNEKILEKTQRLKEHAGSSRWDNSIGFFDNGTQPLRMSFHQYDNHLAVTDDRDVVRIWDWKRQKSLCRFSNGNPAGSKINGARFINEDDQSLLMTGSSDGILRLFKDYASPDSVSLVSSFRALTDHIPSTTHAAPSLVFDWLQGTASVLVAGDANTIRVWSAANELCTHEIRARSGSCVTSLTSDQVQGNICGAGFGDGAVRIYDQRARPTQSLIRVWKEQHSWLMNIHMQRGGQRELLSAATDGSVKLWDLRMAKSLATIRATRDTLRSLSVHEHAPVFAAGSERHSIKVYNMKGAFLSSFEPWTGFMNGRGQPISTTVFHPHRMLLAGAALGDGHVSLFSCVGRKRREGVVGEEEV